jgi:hypothetical protein
MTYNVVTKESTDRDFVRGIHLQNDYHTFPQQKENIGSD